MSSNDDDKQKVRDILFKICNCKTPKKKNRCNF